tara:strand:- start:5172 stop:5744 length:573 start_codon:yes stop_codon:yes gene_type:complete
MGKRLGKYTVSDRQMAIYKQDTQLGSVTSLSLSSTLTVTGEVNFNGGLKCDTNKFTVANTSGNVATAGDCDVAGDTTLAGNLTLSDGGTVTQASSKTTGVTLSKNSGQITMNGAELAAGAEATFAVTNTQVSATDVVIVNHGSAGTAGSYLVGVSEVGSGSFKITVSNVSAGALSEAIVINFVVIGGASS